MKVQVLLLALAGTSLASPPKPHKPLVTTSSLIKTIESRRLFNHARQFLEHSKISGGSRAFGLPSHNATVNYIKKALEKTGHYDVRLQTFPHPFSIGTANITVDGRALETGFLGYSPSGTVTAPVVVINDMGCEQSDYPADLSGKIGLVMRGVCTFGFKVATAGAKGAAGVIVYNNADDSLPGATLGGLENEIGPFTPSALISGLEGKAIIAAVGAGQQIVATVSVDSENDYKWTSNVIATTKEGDKKNVVAAGGHTDSVIAGPGINDDSSGSIGLLEIALQLPRFRVKNAVRFTFWTAEEYGLVGSAHYVQSLTEEEQNDIALYLNFDMIASPNHGFFIFDGDGSSFNLTGPAGSDHIEKTFQNYYKQARLVSAPAAFTGRSDYGSFLAVGIPAGGLFTGHEAIKTKEQAKWWGGKVGELFDPCYHRACDTLDNLNVPAWTHNVKAAAFAIATYAKNLKGIPRPRPRQVVVQQVAAAADDHSACEHVEL